MDPFLAAASLEEKGGCSHPNVENIMVSHFGPGIFYTEAHPARPNHKPSGPDQPCRNNKAGFEAAPPLGYALLFIHIFIWPEEPEHPGASPEERRW